MEKDKREIFCTGCNEKVIARLTDGKEIYNHRQNLHDLPFWKCDICKNFVGCHHKTNNRTNPLGCIPNKEIKNARKHIHKILDPLWKNKIISRKELYNRLSNFLGWGYHTANIKNLEEARKVYVEIKNIRQELTHKANNAHIGGKDEI